MKLLVHTILASALVLSSAAATAIPAAATTFPTEGVVTTLPFDAPPSQARITSLPAVSCPPIACVALGRIESGSFGLVVARSHGYDPSYIRLPRAARPTVQDLTCVTFAWCAGVVRLDNGARTTVVALTSDDSGGWQLTSLGLAAVRGDRRAHYGVSCVGVGQCVIAGDTANAGPRLWRLADGAWTRTRVPHHVSGVDVVSLADIACATADRCTAVGQRKHGGLALRLAGTTWTAAALRPAGGAVHRLRMESVACLTAAECTASGVAGNRVEIEMLADGTWSVRSDMLGSDSHVACAHPAYCLVAARSAGGTSAVVNEALTTGAVTHLGPSLAGSANPDFGLTCAAPRHCVEVAAGDSAGDPGGTMASLSGPSWVEAGLDPPTSPAQGDATDVSCERSTPCVAVGRYIDSDGVDRATSWIRTGGEWHQSAMIDGDGTDLGTPAAVSCYAVGCVAVGATDDGHPLAWRLSDGNWTAMSVGMLGHPSLALADVSCTSRTFCVAAGQFYTDYPDRVQDPVAAVSVLGGDTWTTQAIEPAAGAQTVELAAVDCTGRGECTAIGDQGPAGSPTGIAAILHDGSRTQEVIRGLDYLFGVSCPAPGACVAVGQSGYAAQGQSGWTVNHLGPDSEFDYSHAPFQVDCPQVGTCLALLRSTQFATLSAGTWTVAHRPVPGDGEYYRYYGASCTSGGTCQIAGTAFGKPIVRTVHLD